MTSKRLWVVLTVAATALLCGCSQKLTYDRWQTIYDGQSADGVEATLGDPVERLDMRWMYMDPDHGVTADIYFQDQKVIGKTWSDPDRGIVGKSPHVNNPGDSESIRLHKIE